MRGAELWLGYSLWSVTTRYCTTRRIEIGCWQRFISKIALNISVNVTPIISARRDGGTALRRIGCGQVARGGCLAAGDLCWQVRLYLLRRTEDAGPNMTLY